MDGALAAIHHDDQIKRLVEFVEADFVIADEGIRRHATGFEVGVDVMPVEPRSAHGDGGAAISRAILAVGGGSKSRHLAVHTVVVIEKAVADVHDGSGGSGGLGDFGFGLRVRITARERQREQGHGGCSCLYCGSKHVAPFK